MPEPHFELKVGPLPVFGKSGFVENIKEAIKFIDFIYQSIGNDERNLNMHI